MALNGFKVKLSVEEQKNDVKRKSLIIRRRVVFQLMMRLLKQLIKVKEEKLVEEKGLKERRAMKVN